MHISDEHGFVYLSVPHTASWSTRNWLTAHYGARQVGPVHGVVIPDGGEKYLVAANIRDPFNRVTAMWRKIHRKPDRNSLSKFLGDLGLEWPESFPEFVDLLPYMGGHKNAQFTPQATLLDGVAVDRFVIFESLLESIHSLPFVENNPPPFPHANRNPLMREVTPERMRREYPDTVPQVQEWDPGIEVPS